MLQKQEKIDKLSQQEEILPSCKHTQNCPVERKKSEPEETTTYSQDFSNRESKKLQPQSVTVHALYSNQPRSQSVSGDGSPQPCFNVNDFIPQLLAVSKKQVAAI